MFLVSQLICVTFTSPNLPFFGYFLSPSMDCLPFSRPITLIACHLSDIICSIKICWPSHFLCSGSSEETVLFYFYDCVIPCQFCCQTDCLFSCHCPGLRQQDSPSSPNNGVCTSGICLLLMPTQSHKHQVQTPVNSLLQTKAMLENTLCPLPFCFYCGMKYFSYIQLYLYSVTMSESQSPTPKQSVVAEVWTRKEPRAGAGFFLWCILANQSEFDVYVLHLFSRL